MSFTENNLLLKISVTKALIGDFRKKEARHTPLPTPFELGLSR